MTKLIVRRTYFGPDNRRLTVLAVKGQAVTVRRPISLTVGTISKAEMQEFVAASPLRNYYHKSGEVRTKFREDAEGVLYTTPDYEVRTVSKAEWAKWRKGAA